MSERFYTNAGSVRRQAFSKRDFVRRAYPYGLLLFDVLAITSLFAVLNSLRSNRIGFEGMTLEVNLILVVTNVVGLFLIGGYSYRLDKRSHRFISEHVIVSLVIFVVSFFAIFAGISYGSGVPASRSVVSGTLGLFTVLSLATRYGTATVQARYQRGNAICIIGAGATARDLYRRLVRQGWASHTYVVSVTGNAVGQPLMEGDTSSPQIRSLEDLPFDSWIDGRFVEEYIVTVPVEELPVAFARELAGASFNRGQVATVESYLKRELKMVPPSELSLGWAFEDGFRLQKSVTYGRIKRLSDVVLAALGLLLAAPLMLAVAVVQAVKAPGPLIFSQMRVGRGEKPFLLHKFRTMTPGSELGEKYTQPNDTRLTRIGGFLRRTRLDELPQLWNVLKGDMSLIGPRAEWVDLVRSYEEQLPFYHFRHAVKPGITGWAQVNYSYGASADDALEKLCYDLYYVRHYSLLLDLSIIVKTIYIMTFARGR